MNLMEVVSAANGLIKGSADYSWECFGTEARYLDIGNEETGHLASAIFDINDGTVYAVEIFLKSESVAFRWVDDRYYDLFLKECSENSVNASIAFDTVKFQKISETEALIVIDELTKEFRSELPEEEDDIT